MSETNIDGIPQDTAPEQAQTSEKPAEKTRQMSFTPLDDGTVRADFGPGLDPLIFSPQNVPEAPHAPAMVEGFLSRLRGHTSRLTGDDRTPENLRAAIEKGIASLYAGNWKIERVAAGEDFSQEVRAAFVYRQMKAAAQNVEFTDTLASVNEAWQGLTEEQKKQLKATARYQLALAQVKAEDAAKKQAALLAKLAKEDADAGF